MKASMLRLLGAKELLRVMGAQSTSTYANQIISFVIPWLVLTRTGSALNAGMVAFAMAAASFTGTLLGGIVTDRIGGRKVSIIADTLSFMTTLVLVAALSSDYFALWLVVVSQVIGVFFDGPGQIAKNTTIPAAAKANKIPMVRAMGLQQTLQNVAMFVGPISAGVLVAAFTENITLAFAGALFLLAIYFVTRLPRKVMVHEHPMSVAQTWRDMVEAVRFLRKEPFLWPMQLFGPWMAFVVGPIATIIFPAWFIFAHQSPRNLGIFLGAQAIGGMIGGFIFAALAPKVSQRKWLASACALYALALLGLSYLEPGSLLTIAVGFTLGLVFTGIMTIPYTAFYARTPERLLGRVNSLGAAVGFIIIALASLFFGWFINTTSPEAAIRVSAGVMTLIAAGSIGLPFMKLLDMPPELDKQDRTN
jgi:MFS family permease